MSLQWHGRINKATDYGDFHACVYLLYDSPDYAWIVSHHRSREHPDGILEFGREPTENAAMTKAESVIERFSAAHYDEQTGKFKWNDERTRAG